MRRDGPPTLNSRAGEEESRPGPGSSSPAPSAEVKRHRMTTPIPQLSADDYPVFQHTCLGLPPTHAEWEFNQRRYHQKHEASGQEIISIPIAPFEFEEYCRRETSVPTADALYGLAAEKFSRAGTVATFSSEAVAA